MNAELKEKFLAVQWSRVSSLLHPGVPVPQCSWVGATVGWWCTCTPCAADRGWPGTPREGCVWQMPVANWVTDNVLLQTWAMLLPLLPLSLLLSPYYSSRRHSFQYGHFIGLATCVNRFYCCLIGHNFCFWQGRPFTRVPQVLPACQARWVTLVYTGSPPSTCVCNKNTCVEKILHQVLKHLWFCLIKSV